MGLVSSICKRKKRVDNDDIIQNNYTQTNISKVQNSPSTSSEKTQCSAMTREPTNNSSFRYPYYFSPPSPAYSKPIRGHPDFPLFSTPFYLPYNNHANLTYRPSNPYIAQAYSHRVPSVSPSSYNTNHLRATHRTSIHDPSRVPTVSDIVQTTEDENRTITRIDSSITTDNHEESLKENHDDGARLIRRSTSAPIDMFLIDISNEHVLLGQPVSMNIRHLLLDTLESHQANSSAPIRIEPATITTYAHENLLNYIPYVCERYPNATVESDQLTRNTLHVRVPSQFSHSLNTIN
jgi:hypothetical protein